LQILLQAERHERNSQPAGQSEQDGFETIGQQLFQMGIQADGSHGQHDAELAGGSEQFAGGRSQPAEGACDGSGQEPENEPGENFDETEVACIRVFAGYEDRQYEGNGDNHQRAGQLHNRSEIACFMAEGVAGSHDGGSIVDGCACPHAEADDRS
jgi:hypothetical protein